ncbi:helix-turn-helix domain-containing protein [Leptolyngbya sp. AN03gr2]|uniref:helix-turn-helix domain-containing protein n=1 Tax=unclassified Leptolyngbya TaxID=2650499 RepID=UPI003D319C97
MTEIVFLIENAPEGDYTSRALRVSIFTEADNIDQLREKIRDAVRCHFPQNAKIQPSLIFCNPMAIATSSEVLTLEEAADYLRLSPEVVERQAIQGSIPGRNIENEWRFLKSAIDDWLRTPTSHAALLQQIGAFADDETLTELRDSIYRDRGRPEVDEGQDA